MAILNTIIASSAVALSILAQAATPVNALAAPHGHNHVARHLGTTPNHNGVLKRKRNSHKLRKRCIAQTATSSTDASPPASTDNGNNNNNGNTDTGSTNNNSGNTGTYTPPANTPTCQGGKWGLGWAPDIMSNYIPNAKSSKTCFYYNWSSWAADASLTSGLTFIPMFWGGDHVEDFQSNVINSDNNYGIAMAMNEVNQNGQANVDEGTGAAWWRQYLLPLRNKGYYLISPSTTNAPSGMTWMQNWWGQLADSEKPDGIAIHWYGTSFSDFSGYVGYVQSLFPGKDIWITEFACTDFSYQTTCDVGAFAPQAATFIDNNPVIKGAFPFGFVGSMQGVQEDNRLMDPNSGQLTQIAYDYIN